MSLLWIGYLVVLALCAAWVDVAAAQNLTFVDDFIAALGQAGFSNFSTVVSQVTTSGLTTFAQAISDPSSPQTLFIPTDLAFAQPSVNFGGYQYQPDNTQFLSSLLLYHLAPGTWLQADIGANNNHTIIPTSLHGGNMALLEDDEAQVIACGISSNGFEIYNQRITTIVQQTLLYNQLTLHIVNAVIGIPGSLSFTMQDFGLTKVQALQASTGITDLGNSPGLTVFAAEDAAFGKDNTQISLAGPLTLFENHVISGKTVWSTMFQDGQYTSDSGMNYTFTQNSDQSYSVTLNGVTANIVRSDFLVSNGVMHILDQVLYNVTKPLFAADTSSSDSSPASLGSSASGSSTTPPPPTSLQYVASSATSEPSATNTGSPSSPAGSLGPLVIVGIVALGLSMLVFPIIGIKVWRVHRRVKREEKRQREALDLAQDACNIQPFWGNMDTRRSNSLHSTAQLCAGTTSSSGSIGTIASPVQYIPMRDKIPMLPQPVLQHSTGELRLQNPSRSTVPSLYQESDPRMPQLVDQIVEQVAQRIDRHPPPRSDTVGTGAQDNESFRQRPPTYCTMPRPSKR